MPGVAKKGGKTFDLPAVLRPDGGWAWAALVAGVVVLGAVLRFYGLGSESLWIDEGVSVDRAGFEAARIIRQAPTDPTPPLYYLLLHYWIAVFGNSDYAVRVPSALAGTLSVLVMCRLGAVLSSRTTGLAAALVLAAAPWHVFFSQEARAYQIFCLLVLLSFYFFIRLLREERPAVTLLVGYYYPPPAPLTRTCTGCSCRPPRVCTCSWRSRCPGVWGAARDSRRGCR